MKSLNEDKVSRLVSILLNRVEVLGDNDKLHCRYRSEISISLSKIDLDIGV
jgi:hypothetical protein